MKRSTIHGRINLITQSEMLLFPSVVDDESSNYFYSLIIPLALSVRGSDSVAAGRGKLFEGDVDETGRTCIQGNPASRILRSVIGEYLTNTGCS